MPHIKTSILLLAEEHFNKNVYYISALIAILLLMSCLCLKL